MAKLILVRHGESAGNRDRVFGDDPHSLPLTPLGYQQARAAAQLIAAQFQAESVISSPFVRAHETARVIAEFLSLPLSLEPQLFERDVGLHRGKSYDSLYQAADYAESKRFTWRPPEGESYEDVRSRVGPLLDRLAHDHLGRDTVVVSHGGVMMALWAHVAGRWEQAHAPPNCGIVVIEHDATGYRPPRVAGTAPGVADTGG